MERQSSREKKLNKIINHYGAESQQIVAIEECSELIKSITKYMRKNKDKDAEDICEHLSLIEEISDVEIMIEQLKIIYKIDEALVEAYKDDKIERTLKIINKEAV